MSTKILLIDQYPEFQQSLEDFFLRYGEFQLVGCTNSVETALDLIYKLCPPIELLNAHIQGQKCFDFIPILKEKFPSAFIILLSLFYSEVYIQQVIRLGAHGYIAKTEMVDRLIPEFQRLLSSEKGEQY